MFDNFLQHNKEHQLFDSNDKILLTISGGIDSMTMLHLFLKGGYSIAIAHCNFRLRGIESDGDQQFVSNVAKQLKIPFYTISFNTKQIAADKKISIQMAARDLRYKWFYDIANKNGYTKIATAHNLNDVAETFLINLSRGTGIKGLTGITVKNGNIIRPLLFAPRNTIKAYSRSNKIDFREDSSNAETKYLRNAIRHLIVPAFENISPNFLQAVQHTSRLLFSANKIYLQGIDNMRNQIFKTKNEEVQLDISQLTPDKVNPEILYELLRPYGFSLDSCLKILEAKNSQPGLTFWSATHRIVKDRENFILTPIREQEDNEFEIFEDTQPEETPTPFIIKRLKINQLPKTKTTKHQALFDADTIKFPLTLRKWRDGDFFYPFGMEGKKKLSDFFTDNKFSRNEKEAAWLLTSGKNIIWVVNHRSDNRFRITKNTTEVISIETKN
jgi:tRNA(Ile)-lysidine synthase